MEFREDLKLLFEKSAVGGKPVTFLFNDNQVCACVCVWIEMKFLTLYGPTNCFEVYRNRLMAAWTDVGKNNNYN